MTDKLSVDEAAEVMRIAMRDVIKRHSLWYLLQGALMTLTGVVALLFPVFSSIAVVVMLGWLLVINGVFQGISLIGATNVPHFWLQLISVALSIVIGTLFLRDPGGGLLSLTLLLIVFFMVGGMAKIIFALTIRPFAKWGWVLASGLVGVVLSLILWSSLPVAAGWLLGLFVGIQLISEGLALTYMAWHVRSA
ncbi:MAG: HdeD family acid-resistance protein [Anderseniella sp.]